MQPRPSKADFALITAADRTYFLAVLNLIGSIQRNSDIFKQIAVYDLGLTTRQRQHLGAIESVEVRPVAPFTPHWQKCWSWKPWIWADSQSTSTLYLDAGVEVLADLSEVSLAISRDGYFVVSQNQPGGGHFVKDIVPAEYFRTLKVSPSIQDREVIAAGIIGFKKDSVFATQIIPKLLALVKQGYNLGWSKGELDRNQGLNYLPDPILRDCPLFRHDQTLLNLEFYRAYPHPVLQPLVKYAQIDRPTPDSKQLIWHHRRQSNLPWIRSVRYRNHGFRNKLEAQILRLIRQLRRLSNRHLP